MTALLRIIALWRRRWKRLALGLAVSVASVGTAAAMMALSGSLVAGLLAGGALAAPIALRALGPFRVVLRYLERLTTHDATFRALAELRVWFFRGLATRSAGGLGFRRAGDVLSRLVQDVEALDGVYLRTLVPLVGAVVLLPVLVVVLGRADIELAVAVAALFVLSAFVLPAIAARNASASGVRMATAGGALRVACLDALHGLREVRAFSAEGRMLANVQAREASFLTRSATWPGAARSTARLRFCARRAAFSRRCWRRVRIRRRRHCWRSSRLPRSRRWAACRVPA